MGACSAMAHVHSKDTYRYGQAELGKLFVETLVRGYHFVAEVLTK